MCFEVNVWVFFVIDYSKYETKQLIVCSLSFDLSILTFNCPKCKCILNKAITSDIWSLRVWHNGFLPKEVIFMTYLKMKLNKNANVIIYFYDMKQ